MRNNYALSALLISALALSACQPMRGADSKTVEESKQDHDTASTAVTVSNETAESASKEGANNKAPATSSPHDSGAEPSVIPDHSEAAPTKGEAVFIGITTRPVPVVNIATPATLSIRSNCLIVTSKGQDYTALFNGKATLSGNMLRYESGTLALNKEVLVPGGIVMRDEFRLKAEPPAGCPQSFFAVGG